MLRHTFVTTSQPRHVVGGHRRHARAAQHGHDAAAPPEKIANRTVAEEYFAVTDKVEALYGKPPQLPADAIGPKMARLRREYHSLLGNG